MSRVYCDEIAKKVKGFDKVTLYHGINTFFVSKPYQTCFNTILKNKNIQLCTSTKHLGFIGVTVKGDILIASNIDLFSGLDGYRRYFDEKQLKHLVYDYSELEHHLDDEEENNEIVITNQEITGIWITNDAPAKLRELAEKWAKEHNLPLIEKEESIFA